MVHSGGSGSRGGFRDARADLSDRADPDVRDGGAELLHRLPRGHLAKEDGTPPSDAQGQRMG